MPIRLWSDYSDIDAEIDRIADEPNRKMVALLDGVLHSGFGQVAAATHIDTGSLKGSLKEESGGDTAKDQWVGTIQAGGPSPGVNNPVDYAIYEKARGGEHDFFAGLPGLHPAYVAAILKGLSR